MTPTLMKLAVAAIAMVGASACQPTGQVENLVSDFDVAAGSGNIVVEGWAEDADADGPIPLRVRLDGERVIDAEAEALLNAQSVAPGTLVSGSVRRAFRVVLSDVGPGEHEVCVEVINTGFEDEDADLGCKPVVVGELQSDLFAARQRWAVVGIDDYVVRYENRCFCTPDRLGPFEVTISGADASAITIASGQPAPAAAALTAEDLFDVVQEAIDRPAAVLRVTYDELTGVPLSIYIDWNAMIADEETSIEIEPLLVKTRSTP